MSTTSFSQNGFTFTVDNDTGTTVIEGDLQSTPAPRDGAVQAAAGGEDRAPGDHGGHAIAARFGAPTIEENVFAQSGSLNQGEYKVSENAEARLMGQGANVHSQVTAYMNGSQRPETFLKTDELTYPDGRVDVVHLSFPNLSKEEQEELAQEMQRLDIQNPDPGNEPNPGDTLRTHFSPEDYAQLMKETDKELGGIRQEYEGHTYHPFSGTSETQTTGAMAGAGSHTATTPDSSGPGSPGTGHIDSPYCLDPDGNGPWVADSPTWPTSGNYLASEPDGMASGHDTGHGSGTDTAGFSQDTGLDGDAVGAEGSFGVNRDGVDGSLNDIDIGVDAGIDDNDGAFALDGDDFSAGFDDISFDDGIGGGIGDDEGFGSGDDAGLGGDDDGMGID